MSRKSRFTLPPYAIGLALLAFAGFSALMLFSAPSRARLSAAAEMAQDLHRREAEFVARAKAVARNGAEGAEARWPKDMIWGGSDAAAQELAFQTALLDAASAADLRVLSFGPGAGPKGLTQKTLGFELELEGDHAALADFLARVEAQRPRLAILSLWLRHKAGGQEVGKALLTARLGLWGFVKDGSAPGAGEGG